MNNSDLLLSLMRSQKRTRTEAHEDSSFKALKPRQLSILSFLGVSPKQSNAAKQKDQSSSQLKTPHKNVLREADTENIQSNLTRTSKTPKKVLHAASYRSMKRPKKDTSPISKKLLTVTENLIKANQFQSDTPTKSFKIFCSKNDNDEDESYDADDEYPWTKKQIYRPRVELPTQYLGSNISFEEGKNIKTDVKKNQNFNFRSIRQRAVAEH